ncbi:hypothetical protein NQZ68_021938 [Dissostichus eleginoides]|nr:hypothetical protein NQZ68_021938 [Dissostichus eleginoides]
MEGQKRTLHRSENRLRVQSTSLQPTRRPPCQHLEEDASHDLRNVHLAPVTNPDGPVLKWGGRTIGQEVQRLLPASDCQMWPFLLHKSYRLAIEMQQQQSKENRQQHFLDRSHLTDILREMRPSYGSGAEGKSADALQKSPSSIMQTFIREDSQDVILLMLSDQEHLLKVLPESQSPLFNLENVEILRLSYKEQVI